MNKKTYIAPVVEVLDMAVVEMMASSVVGISNTTTNADARMSNDRRGSWGNIWD